jgi:hypothetical protein
METAYGIVGVALLLAGLLVALAIVVEVVYRRYR